MKRFENFNIRASSFPYYFSKFVFFFILLNICNFAYCNDTIQLKITFKKNIQKVNISKAPLKYNKAFAYSLTFDDGLASAFLTAFPLQNGGKVSGTYIDEWKSDQGGDGQIYPGLYYTDGCGTKIPFRSAIAINIINRNNEDTHDGHHNGYMNWNQIKELYNAGWDIVNHSYSHATGSGTDFDKEILTASEYILDSTGSKVNTFFVPGGEGPKNYESDYVKAAFRNKMLFSDGPSKISGLVNVDSLIITPELVIGRAFVTSNPSMLNVYRDSNSITSPVDFMASKAVTGQHYWYNELTHGCGNDNLWGISLQFRLLNYFLNQLNIKYGYIGSDNLWMAPYQEVMEYLLVKNYATLNYKTSKKEIIVTIDISKVPKNLRRYAISLTLESNADIDSIQSSGVKSCSFQQSGINRLINLEM